MYSQHVTRSRNKTEEKSLLVEQKSPFLLPLLSNRERIKEITSTWLYCHQSNGKAIPNCVSFSVLIAFWLLITRLRLFSLFSHEKYFLPLQHCVLPRKIVKRWRDIKFLLREEKIVSEEFCDFLLVFLAKNERKKENFWLLYCFFIFKGFR